MKINKHLAPTLLGLTAMTFTASAAVLSTGTFVAAVDGVNSFKSSDGVTAFSSITGSQANLWQDRSAGTFNIVNTGNEASGGYQGQDKPNFVFHTEIVTTITGLLPNTSYDVYMMMGISTGGNSGTQAIDAGFASGSLTTLSQGTTTLTGQALGAAGDWKAAEHLIGTASSDAGGNLKVYVDATNGAERSIYNGLSYVQVPEPSSAALLGLGGLALILRRRK